MEYPKSSLGTLRTLVQTAVARSDAEINTVIDVAINWAALLAAILFKPTELHRTEFLTLPSGQSQVDLTGLSRWMTVIKVFNTTDNTRMWMVPYEYFDVTVPKGTNIKYYAIYGNTLFVNTTASTNKQLEVSFAAFPHILNDVADILEFGGHDSFIVSTATAVVWAFLEEGESVDVFNKLISVITGTYQISSQERSILEGQWRIYSEQQRR